MGAPTLTHGQIAEARKLLSKGWTYNRLAKHFGVGFSTMKIRLDPEYGARVKDQWRERGRKKAETGARAYYSRSPAAEPHLADRSTTAKLDALKRLAEIPPDTRDLTGILCGDPIPNDPRRHWVRREA